MKSFWKTYNMGLVPGPTKVPAEIGAAFAQDFGSTDLEASYFEYYVHMQERVQRLLNTKNEVVFMTGEAMVTLWGALKSVLKQGDVVLSIGCGLFGEGFGEMAKSIGAVVYTENFAWDEPSIGEEALARIRERVSSLKPKLITAVHCETPCGSINIAVPEIGRIAKEHGALFCVDAVSSVAGLPVLVDAWDIDLALVGSQKALSCPPEFSFMTVSEKAWQAIQDVKYVGYDALLPFKTALAVKEFPYTPSWRSLAALDVALARIDAEGLEKVFARHKEAQAYTKKRLTDMGIELFLKSASEEIFSPTVTAAYVPKGWTWEEFDNALRAQGLVIGGTYGKIAGKVLRIGHMGSQADLDLLKRAMNVMESVIKSKK